MSMTREEAIKHLLHDWHINLGCDFAVKPGRMDDFLAAIDVALTALRGPTRGQLSEFKTCDLVDELRKREGVETHAAEPYQDVTVSVNGPAVVLIVTD